MIGPRFRPGSVLHLVKKVTCGLFPFPLVANVAGKLVAPPSIENLPPRKKPLRIVVSRALLFVALGRAKTALVSSLTLVPPRRSYLAT